MVVPQAHRHLIAEHLERLPDIGHHAHALPGLDLFRPVRNFGSRGGHPQARFGNSGCSVPCQRRYSRHGRAFDARELAALHPGAVRALDADLAVPRELFVQRSAAQLDRPGEQQAVALGDDHLRCAVAQVEVETDIIFRRVLERAEASKQRDRFGAHADGLELRGGETAHQSPDHAARRGDGDDLGLTGFVGRADLLMPNDQRVGCARELRGDRELGRALDRCRVALGHLDVRRVREARGYEADRPLSFEAAAADQPGKVLGLKREPSGWIVEQIVGGVDGRRGADAVRLARSELEDLERRGAEVHSDGRTLAGFGSAGLGPQLSPCSERAFAHRSPAAHRLGRAFRRPRGPSAMKRGALSGWQRESDRLRSIRPRRPHDRPKRGFSGVTRPARRRPPETGGRAIQATRRASTGAARDRQRCC